MPKQRHHQHQRMRGQARMGLRLPRINRLDMPGMPPVIYPDGWMTRPVSPILATLRLALIIAAAVIAFAFILVGAITVLGGR